MRHPRDCTTSETDNIASQRDSHRDNHRNNHRDNYRDNHRDNDWDNHNHQDNHRGNHRDNHRDNDTFSLSCVLPHPSGSCPKDVTTSSLSFSLSPSLSVSYLAYVTHVLVYSIRPVICPKNVTNYLVTAYHGSLSCSLSLPLSLSVLCMSYGTNAPCGAHAGVYSTPE